MPVHDLEAALLPLLDSAIRASAADFGNIQFCDPYAGVLRIVAQRGFSQSFLEFFRFVEKKGTACGAALNNGARIVVHDVRVSPLFSESTRRAVLEADARAVQSTAIRSATGLVVGVLSTHYRRAGVPTAEQLKEMDGVIPDVAAILETRVADVRRFIEHLHDESPKTRTIRGSSVQSND